MLFKNELLLRVVSVLQYNAVHLNIFDKYANNTTGYENALTKCVQWDLEIIFSDNKLGSEAMITGIRDIYSNSKSPS